MATATKRQHAVHVRWMVRRDIPGVLTVQREAAKLGSREEWTEEAILQSLRQRNCIGMVTECGDRITGFMIYELHRHSLTLLCLVAEDDRARVQLTEKLLYKLESHRRKWIGLPNVEAWRTDTVRDLCRAKAVYLPILADAMEEAGCPFRWLLTMFREAGKRAERLYSKLRKCLEG